MSGVKDVISHASMVNTTTQVRIHASTVHSPHAQSQANMPSLALLRDFQFAATAQTNHWESTNGLQGVTLSVNGPYHTTGMKTPANHAAETHSTNHPLNVQHATTPIVPVASTPPNAQKDPSMTLHNATSVRSQYSLASSYGPMNVHLNAQIRRSSMIRDAYHAANHAPTEHLYPAHAPPQQILYVPDAAQCLRDGSTGQEHAASYAIKAQYGTDHTV
jgi:hypothetical protein